MEPRKFKEILDRYSKGECTPEEEKLVNEWYNAVGEPADEQVEKDADLEMSERKLMESLLWSRINPRPAKERIHPSRYFMRAAATVLLALVAGASAYFLVKKTDISNTIVAFTKNDGSELSLTHITNNELNPKEISLADGSKVILKANSEIRYPEKFRDEIREIYLTGEAFFEVKRDEKRPFLVYSNEVVTKVLGTSFNIRAYDEDKEITVVVKTGKVSVSKREVSSSGNVSTVIVTPNQQVVYNRENEKVYKQLVAEPEIILPQPTLFKMTYDGAPVTTIFKVLEENYGVDIVYDEKALASCVLTTSMSDEGLYERIAIICKAINAEYTVTDAVIYIKSNGCF